MTFLGLPDIKIVGSRDRREGSEEEGRFEGGMRWRRMGVNQVISI
jgi:hypothetical protein